MRGHRSRLMVDTQAVGGRPDLSIVIVHYDTPVELAACLKSVAFATADMATEIFVIDNASASFEPESVTAAVPAAQVLVNDQNLGFARAANMGLRAATGRHLLLLNPDATLAKDALQLMVAYMDHHPEVGCATPRIVLPDGRLDLACRRSFPTPSRAFYRLTLLSRAFPRSRRFAQYNLTYLDEHEETEIDSPCGAFMIVRSEIRDTVGLLDESYFMYGEDLDWSYRMKQAGWSIRYVPITTVTHIKRASSRRSRQRTIRAFHDAMRIFYASHYAHRYPRVIKWLTYGAISARESLELAADRLSKWRLPA